MFTIQHIVLETKFKNHLAFSWDVLSVHIRLCPTYSFEAGRKILLKYNHSYIFDLNFELMQPNNFEKLLLYGSFRPIK